MKLRVSEKNKNLIFGLLSMVIILVVFVAMFFPEIAEYKYSLSHLAEKRDSIDALVVQLNANETIIEDTKNDIELKMIDNERLKNKALKIKSDMANMTFDLHVPSLLVALEDIARDEELDITIYYDQFNASGGSSIAETVPIDTGDSISDDMNPQDQDPPLDQDDTDTTDDERRPPKEVKDVADRNSDRERPNVDGPAMNTPDSQISFASLPISISGDFMNMRNFVRSLDQLDLIEASNVSVVSNGSDVAADILLKIYYGEGVVN